MFPFYFYFLPIQQLFSDNRKVNRLEVEIDSIILNEQIVGSIPIIWVNHLESIRYELYFCITKRNPHMKFSSFETKISYQIKWIFPNEIP